jgi:hypothetical protein
MLFFGLCALALLGETFRRTLVDGAILIAGLSGGVWERLLEVLIDEPDFEWLMIDASHCKVHPHASGARGGNQGMSRTKGGSTQNCIWPWIRMACRSGPLLHKVQQQIARKQLL